MVPFDVSLDDDVTGQQCESTDMPCGVLLQQYEMPWLFKETNTKHSNPQRERKSYCII